MFGVIASYIHTGNRSGALVEVRCQSDAAAVSWVKNRFGKGKVNSVATVLAKSLNQRSLENPTMPQQELLPAQCSNRQF